MAEGINDGLRESSDLLSKVLDNLTKTVAAADSLPAKVKAATKAIKEAASGFSDLGKAADGVSTSSSGTKGSMPWARSVSFGRNTGKGDGAKPPPNGGQTSSSASAAAQPSTSTTVKQAAFTVAAGAAGMGAAVWSGTPGVADAVTRQAGLFPMAFSTPGAVDAEKIDATNRRLRNLLGPNLSGVYDDLAAANLTRYAGFGMNTREFDSNMRTAGTLFAVTGMSNQAGMQAMVGMQSGATGAKMASAGIFTHDLATGNPRDIGAIVDEMWVKGGWEGKDISLEEFEAELAGGFLGSDLRRLFGDNPPLYQAIVEAFRLKVKAKGRSGIRWNASKNDPNSAEAVATEFGLSDLAPQKVLGETNEARRNNLDSASEGLYSGFQASENIIQGFNDALSQATDALGPFADLMYGLKGGVQDFTASGEGASIIQMASSALGIAMPGLKMFMAEGGSATGSVNSVRGTSTSDSVPAMLSRGEYVINARSASILGKDYLDRINSTGQDFGSGFTLPVRQFSGGGGVGQTTLNGWGVGLAPDDPRLADFPVPGTDYSIRLRKDYGPNLIDVAAAWQASPVLGGGKWNLKQGAGTYGYGGTRMNPSGTGWSNHGAGLAMDLLPELLPDYQYGDYFNSQELAAIRGIPGIASGNVVWGGDWDPGSQDQMHFEIQDQNVKPGATLGAADGTELGKGSEGAIPTSRSVNQASAVGWTGSAGPEGMLTPMLAAQGISARWAKATSLSPFNGGAATSNRLSASFTNSLLGPSNAGGAITLYGSSMVGGIQAPSGDSSTSETTDTPGESSDVNTDPGPTGSGPEWLAKFLYAKGLRGDDLRTMWSIGMRESGGTPGAVSSMDGKGMGIFQIQAGVHDAWIKEHYGWSIEEVRADNDKNFQVMLDLSDGSGDGKVNGAFSNLAAWGLVSSSNRSLDASSYGGWSAQEQQDWIMGPFEKYFEEFPGIAKKAGLPGYSQGAWRTQDEVARIHDGEMIIPANAAEEFRKMMREAVSGGRAGGGDVHINLTIARASDEEAMRFAKTVQRILKDDERIDTMRSR